MIHRSTEHVKVFLYYTADELEVYPRKYTTTKYNFFSFFTLIPILLAKSQNLQMDWGHSLPPPVQSICMCMSVCVIEPHRGHADLGCVWTDDLKVKLYILLLIPSSLQVMIDFFSAQKIAPTLHKAFSSYIIIVFFNRLLELELQKFPLF